MIWEWWCNVFFYGFVFFLLIDWKFCKFLKGGRLECLVKVREIRWVVKKVKSKLVLFYVLRFNESVNILYIFIYISKVNII